MSQMCIDYDERRGVYQVCMGCPENGFTWKIIEEFAPDRTYFRGETFMCDPSGNVIGPVNYEWFLEKGAAGRMRRLLHVDIKDTSDPGLLEKKYILRGTDAIQKFMDGAYGEREFVEEFYEVIKGWYEINHDFEEIIQKEPENKQDVLRQVFGEQNQKYFQGMRSAITLLPESTAKTCKKMMGLPEYELTESEQIINA